MSLELSAREILDTGDLHMFEEFLVQNADSLDMNYMFTEQCSFLIVLVQTFRKVKSLIIDRNEVMPVEEYKNTFMFLVEVGCDVNKRDSLGRTVAHWTILLKSQELLSICIRSGYDVMLQDNEGQTVVHLAIRQMDHVALETIKLYSKDADVLESPSSTSGATPLIYAVQIGAIDVVQKLLQLSVNVDAQENNKYKRTALHYALFTDNEEVFELLVKHKAKTDIRDSKNKSVLDKAAEHTKDNFLRIITHYSSSDIFASGDSGTSGFSPIMTACKNNDFDMLCELIKGEGDDLVQHLLTLDSDLRGALHYCSDNTDERCAHKLVQLAPDLRDKKDRNGLAPLHLATISNNANLVKFLLGSGCNVGEQDDDGHTSLHWAVVCCSVDIISMLMEKMPGIAHVGDAFGASPLHYATQSFLNPNGPVQGPRVMKELFKYEGTDINAADDENRTPLLWAACLGITDCCGILLENGANINHRDNKGLSALHCAASRGHYDIVDMLVNVWSVPLDCEDNNLCTPLFYAVTLKHMDIIHFLFEHRCNPNQQDIKGRSVAHCAALKGYSDILDLICNFGGSICLQNREGDLPLHEAAETGQLDVCRLLLKKMEEFHQTALIDTANNMGYTPLHKASANNHREICQLLLEYGADANILAKVADDDHNKVAALHLATDAATILVLKNVDRSVGNYGEVKISLPNGTGSGVVREDIFIRAHSSLDHTEGPTRAMTQIKDDGTSSNDIQVSEDPGEGSEICEQMSRITLVPLCTEVKGSANKTRVKHQPKPPPKRSTVPAKVTLRSHTRLSNVTSTKTILVKVAPRSKPDKETTDPESSCSSILQVTPKSSLSLRSDSRPSDLNHRIKKSVNEYVSVRDRMRSIADQRRMEMFEGFSKTARLNRYSTKPPNSKSTKPHKGPPVTDTTTEVAEISCLDHKVSRKSSVGVLSSRDQVKSAYQCDSTMSTLLLY